MGWGEGALIYDVRTMGGGGKKLNYVNLKDIKSRPEDRRWGGEGGGHYYQKRYQRAWSVLDSGKIIGHEASKLAYRRPFHSYTIKIDILHMCSPPKEGGEGEPSIRPCR